MRSGLPDLSQQLVAVLDVVHRLQIGDGGTNPWQVVVHFLLRSQPEDERKQVEGSDALLELFVVVRVQVEELLQVGLLAEQLHATVVEQLRPDFACVIADADRQDQAVVELGRHMPAHVAAVPSVLQVLQLFVARLASFEEDSLSCGESERRTVELECELRPNFDHQRDWRNRRTNETYPSER